MTLPTFVVIGEPNFFIAEDNWPRGRAADLRRFEHLLGHRVSSHWRWSTAASA